MGQYGFLIIMIVALVAMMVLSNRSRKKMAAQQAEQQRKLADGLVPGAWVKTAFGFWGRYVDQDGDVIILETHDGTETYWERSVIRDIGEPPFAAEETPEETTSTDDGDEPVLGLDAPAPAVHDTDEDDPKQS